MRRLPADVALRVIGFDDGPFGPRRGSAVAVAGVVCTGTRFEGMLFGHVRRDGSDATDVLLERVRRSKFLPQLHLVLLDGISLGGLNIVDLARLSQELGLPAAAVMRRPPDLAAFERAIRRLPRASRRLALVERAGPIHRAPPFFFQVQGASAEEMARALGRLTDRGHVPEALRLAHLVSAAVVTGQSSRRA